MNKLRNLAYITGILLLLTGGLFGQEIKITASSREQVGLDEQFQVKFTVNAKPSGIEFPPFDGFNVILGPSQSSMSSTNITPNGVQQSIQYTYTFHLQAEKKGSYTLKPASVVVKGKTYQSNRLKIEVAEGSSPQNNQRQRPARQQQNTQKQALTSDDLFMKAVVNKSNPYIGEQITVTFRIYTGVTIADYAISKQPAANGFWTESIPDNKRSINKHTERINGKEYIVADIYKMILFPQKTGKLSIDPLEMEAMVQLQTRMRDPFEDFFRDPFSRSPFGGYRNIKTEVKSNKLTLNVKPLPPEGKSTNFNGGVGLLNFRSDLSSTEFKTNEAITLKYTISGSGNLKLIDDLNVTFPPDFDVYDPKVNDQLTVSESGVSGKRTFEYVLIPRNPGDFTIEPVTFSYFDIGKKKYVELQSEKYELSIAKGDGTNSSITVSETSKEDIKYIGKDIHYIVSQVPSLKKRGEQFFLSLPFVLFMIILLILCILIIAFWYRQIKRRSNTVLMKHRKATRVARKRLRKARTYMGAENKAEFYEELSRALWGYLSDKFNIPLADLSIDTVHKNLQHKGISETSLHEITEILNHCEFARFAPEQERLGTEDYYNRAIKTISQIEKELK